MACYPHAPFEMFVFLKFEIILFRNEKLKEELKNSSLLKDMKEALTQMKHMFPDICVADEFQRFEAVKW